MANSAKKEVVGVIQCGNYFLVTDSGLEKNLLQYDWLITSENIAYETNGYRLKGNKIIPIKRDSRELTYKGWTLLSMNLYWKDQYVCECFDENDNELTFFCTASSSFGDTIQSILDKFSGIVDNNYSVEFYDFMNYHMPYISGLTSLVDEIQKVTNLYQKVNKSLSEDEVLEEDLKENFKLSITGKMREYLTKDFLNAICMI